MSKMMRVMVVVMVMVLSCLCITAISEARDSSGFEMRLSYLPSMQDVGDWYEEYLERDYGGWYSVDAEVIVIPVGLSLAHRWDLASVTDGTFAYADVGPAAIMYGDASFWMIPIGGGVGYVVAPEADFSFYGKLGIRYPFAGGDTVDSSSFGLLAAGGVEFAKSDNLLWLIEAAVDGSSVSFSDSRESKDIDLGFLLSVGVKFR